VTPEFAVAGLGALAAPAALYLASRRGTARLAAAYPPDGRLVDVPGGPIHLVDEGPRSAPAIVLIHGASGNQRDLRLSLGARLADRFRVVSLDRPGHGFSGRGPDPEAAEPAMQGAVIGAALTAIGVERALVLGHSFGAAIALGLALARPEIVAGLVLTAPATHPWGGTGISWHNHLIARMPAAGRVFTALVPYPVGRLVMRPAIGAVFRPDPVPPDYAEATGAALVLRPGAFTANAFDVSFAEANFREASRRYPAVSAPAIVVECTADRIVWNHVHVAGLKRDLPAVEVVRFEGTGHMPHWAATGRLADLVAEHARALF